MGVLLSSDIRSQVWGPNLESKVDQREGDREQSERDRTLEGLSALLRAEGTYLMLISQLSSLHRSKSSFTTDVIFLPLEPSLSQAFKKAWLSQKISTVAPETESESDFSASTTAFPSLRWIPSGRSCGDQ